MNRVMGSRAIGAVARGVLFCANYKPVEDMAEEDPDSPWAAPDLTPKRSRFVFGQIKTNISAKAMHSEYHIESKVTGHDPKAKKDIEGSYLVTDQIVPENIEDIVLEQEKRRKSSNTEGGKSMAWLVAYLAGKGEIPSAQVMRNGEAAGHSEDSIRRARRKLGDERVPVRSFGMPRTTTWRLLEE